MTVYVDDMRRRARVTGMWGTWSHLFADSHHELMAFAAQLDMHPEWLQCPGTHREHFDLVDTKRNQAIELGAVPINYPRETGALMQAKRAHAELGICPDGDTVTSREPLQLDLFGEVGPVALEPQRVQMSRQRPWRADHPNAIVVARPTAWGNPFGLGDADPGESGSNQTMSTSPNRSIPVGECLRAKHVRADRRSYGLDRLRIVRSARRGRRIWRRLGDQALAGRCDMHHISSILRADERHRALHGKGERASFGAAPWPRAY